MVIYGVDNTLLSHTNNPKSNFLVSIERPTDGINDSTGAAEKIFSINFTKANKKFSLSLPYSSDESYLYVNKIENCKVMCTITYVGIRFV